MALDRPARSCYLLRRRKKWKTIRDKYPPARNGRRFRLPASELRLAWTGASFSVRSEGRRPPPPPVLYEDSFGNILPCSSDTVAAGIYPPPIPGQGANPQDLRRHGRPHQHAPRQPHPDDSPAPDSGCSGDPCPAGTTCVTAPNPMNILLIMVDQMRAPRWVPSSQSLATLLPNITKLQNMSF